MVMAMNNIYLLTRPGLLSSGAWLGEATKNGKGRRKYVDSDRMVWLVIVLNQTELTKNTENTFLIASTIRRVLYPGFPEPEKPGFLPQNPVTRNPGF